MGADQLAKLVATVAMSTNHADRLRSALARERRERSAKGDGVDDEPSLISPPAEPSAPAMPATPPVGDAAKGERDGYADGDALRSQGMGGEASSSQVREQEEPEHAVVETRGPSSRVVGRKREVSEGAAPAPSHGRKRSRT